jgi:hypothetical protein
MPFHRRRRVGRFKKRSSGRRFTRRHKKVAGRGVLLASPSHKIPGTGLPRRLRMKLVYFDNSTEWEVAGPAQAYYNNTYYITNLYDIDSRLSAGTSVAGNMTAMSTLYAAWRVYGVKWDMQMSHTYAAGPVEAGFILTFNPGDATGANIYTMSEQPFSAKKMMLQAGSGGEKAHFKGYANIGMVYGDRLQYKSDPLTAGTNTGTLASTTAPTKYCSLLQWWRTTTGAVFTSSGIISVNRFVIYVEFYNPHLVNN